jgi:predicted signal transduction protein with EAL and GGDEF domain
LTVTADGVETVEPHRELTRLGCDSCQGFYFARPMAATAIDTLFDPCATTPTFPPDARPDIAGTAHNRPGPATTSGRIPTECDHLWAAGITVWWTITEAL